MSHLLKAGFNCTKQGKTKNWPKLGELMLNIKKNLSVNLKNLNCEDLAKVHENPGKHATSIAE